MYWPVFRTGHKPAPAQKTAGAFFSASPLRIVSALSKGIAAASTRFANLFRLE
jgi:hypothetical protein